MLDPVFTTVATQDQANFIYEQLTSELFVSANHLVRSASFRVGQGTTMRDAMRVLESAEANGFGVRELDIGQENVRVHLDIHRNPV